MADKQGYTQMVTDHIRNEYKFYVSIVVGTVLAIGWANTTFMTTAQAKLTHEQMVEAQQKADDDLRSGIEALTHQQAEIKNLLTTQISKQTLADVKTAIKTNESEQFQTEQFIRVNGTDAQSEKRLQQLRADRAELEIRRNCIINKNPICD